MFNKIRNLRPRTSHVVAAVAMCAALGGTAYAEGLYTGADIIDGTLTGADVQYGSLTGSDIAANSIYPSDLNSLGLQYEIVATSANIQSGKTGTVEAACPAGKKVLGGGHSGARPTESRPSLDGAKWVVTFEAVNSQFFTPVSVSAICAKVS